jgi:acylphosphatase
MLSYRPVGPGMRVARRYIISGRVQGVGFRYFAEAAAAREGLHGWVRNLPDGRVEIAAEGDADALERFERRVRHGPPGARVDAVEIDGTLPDGRDSGFHVR